MVLEKTLENPLDSKVIQPVNPKRNWTWIFTGRTDAEAATPILWPPGVKNWHIRKDPDAGKDWRQEEKWTTEDVMAGWCHQLNVHEFEQGLEVGERQGNLACYSPWGHKETKLSDWTEMNWTFRTMRNKFVFYKPKKKSLIYMNLFDIIIIAYKKLYLWSWDQSVLQIYIYLQNVPGNFPKISLLLLTVPTDIY